LRESEEIIMDNTFIKIDGIKGESTSAQRPEDIEILSFSHGVAMPLTSGASNTARAHGRCVHQDFTFTKFVDISSPTLNLRCSSGDDIKSIELTLFQADVQDKPIQYYTVTFEHCIITNVSVSGGGGGRPVETVSFNYQTIKWSYAQQKQQAPGGNKGKAEAKWDLTTNKAA
jgi:type VI secretion system secreted protein Hcp